MLEGPQSTIGHHQGNLGKGNGLYLGRDYSIYTNMKETFIQTSSWHGNPAHYYPRWSHIKGRMSHHSHKGWINDDNTDIRNDYSLIIIRTEPTGNDKGNDGETSNHIGSSEGSHIPSRFSIFDIYLDLRDNNHSDYYVLLIQARHNHFINSTLSLAQLYIFSGSHFHSIKLEDLRMGGTGLDSNPIKWMSSKVNW